MIQVISAPALQPEIDEELIPPNLIGNCKLATAATAGDDLAPIWNSLVSRTKADPLDAAAFLDLATIALIQGRPKDRNALQARAFAIKKVYRLPAAATARDVIRVLVFSSSGDYLPNMPIEFLLADASVSLDLVYLEAGLPLPRPLPEHDVAFVAIAESSENQALLRELSGMLRAWPRPIVNRPERISPLTRDGAWELLKSIPELHLPATVRVDRSAFARIGCHAVRIDSLLGRIAFPIIARPLDAHLGDGLCKLDHSNDITSYLSERSEKEFFISPFVDYRGDDGLYRKYRVALIDRMPYAVHMAISEHWMINYLNANMNKSAAKRLEEAAFMADFDRGFAARHAKALGGIAERTNLEYLPLDCAETRDGRLLLFELGTNMIVHRMDPVDVFPYKRAQMDKIAGALEKMLRRYAGSLTVDGTFADIQ